jgi:hypothetical protein
LSVYFLYLNLACICSHTALIIKDHLKYSSKFLENPSSLLSPCAQQPYGYALDRLQNNTNKWPMLSVMINSTSFNSTFLTDLLSPSCCTVLIVTSSPHLIIKRAGKIQTFYTHISCFICTCPLSLLLAHRLRKVFIIRSYSKKYYW